MFNSDCLYLLSIFLWYCKSCPVSVGFLILSNQNPWIILIPRRGSLSFSSSSILKSVDGRLLFNVHSCGVLSLFVFGGKKKIKKVKKVVTVLDTWLASVGLWKTIEMWKSWTLLDYWIFNGFGRNVLYNVGYSFWNNGWLSALGLFLVFSVSWHLLVWIVLSLIDDLFSGHSVALHLSNNPEQNPYQAG